MHRLFSIIFSLLFLCLETTTTTSNQLAAVGGRGYDNGVGVIHKCFDKERLALLQFKSGLQDPNDYGCLSTWTAEEEDCCYWSGVKCHNQTGHVIELEMTDCGLVGKISHSLLNLTYLNHLDLSYNSFSGTVPPEFGNLTNLQVLRLGEVGRCRVENIDWLSRLSHLEYLRMDGVSLAKANHWVDVILSLPKLSYLSLDGCELSHVMHPYSSSFLNSSSSSIKSLYLQDNNLNSSMYPWLFPLTSNKLHSLYLSSNMLDGIPRYLGNLCYLETLYFINNSAVVEFPVFLNNLSGCTSLALQLLDVSNNHLSGSLPDEIQKFTSLTVLYLSQNQLNGTISEKLWELPKLKYLDFSKNSLQGVPFSDHMSNHSYVESIDLSSCKLGPHFPKWIQNLKNLTSLNLANTGISDTIPLEFWVTWPSRLEFLNLSSNNIRGKLPDLLSNFNNYSAIDLSSNRFDGPIPNVSSTVISLNLSKNNFSGGIFFLCRLVGWFLEFLDLSQNFLSVPVPDCLWQNTELRVLNLGNNNFFGRLPTSVTSLTELEVLDLYNNEFSGELPLFLQNCTRLSVLNLGANKFSGNVPIWIGENLSGLYVLILTSNKFFGTIPLQLCQLQNLQILDLSKNNLHGTIPSCVYNLSAMVQEGHLEDQNQHAYGTSWGIYGEYLDHAMIGWQGDEREFFNNLKLLKMLDLSSNNLTGRIPFEITNLHELIALNLSKNALHGEIPQEIGQMKNLLALDLSRNSFSGGIPSSMSRMTFLSYLDVSSNSLSGRIPSSTQLQSFNSSRYDGNVGLCGLPLPQKCQGDEEQEVPSVVGKSEGDGEDINEDWGWFYIGVGTGFATGFWIVCGTILVNRRGRHAFFHFYDSFKNWVYVKVSSHARNHDRANYPRMNVFDVSSMKDLVRIMR